MKRWINIYFTSKSIEAQAIKAYLEDGFGISVEIINRQDSSYNMFGEIELYVLQKNATNAKSYIAKYFEE